MIESSVYDPLFHAGSIRSTKDSELRFFVVKYKGQANGTIRTFIARDDYTGPTKAGIGLNAEMIEQVARALEGLPQQPGTNPDKELARLHKKPGLEVVVRVDTYKGRVGITIREWVDDEVYVGWSKRGVRMAYCEAANAIKYLRDMAVFLKELRAFPQK